MIKKYHEAFGVNISINHIPLALDRYVDSRTVVGLPVSGTSEIEIRAKNDSLVKITVQDKSRLARLSRTPGREVYIESESEDAVREVADVILGSAPVFYSEVLAA